MKAVEPGLSAIQNINNICFTESGILFDEFNRLYSSLFDRSEAYLEIMKVLAKNKFGMNKELLAKKLKLSSSGGTLTKRLNELEEAGFVLGFTPFGHDKKGTYYRIIDEYSYFYLTWVAPVVRRIKLGSKQSNYWQTKSQGQSFKTWSSYAFESVCYKHIESIINTLNIKVGYELGSWRYMPSRGIKQEKGVQIDLIIDRDDGVINICEIKYSDKRYHITKQYANE